MHKIIPHNAVLIPDQAQQVFSGKIFDVYQWPQIVFDGSTLTFEMLKRPDTVKVICVANDQLLVLDEAQPNHQAHKSFAGGRIDPEDQAVVAAAQREVREETGYSFKNWRLLKVWQPQVKIEWFVHLLLAWEVVDQQAANFDAGEKIVVQSLSFGAVKQLVMNASGHLGESRDVFDKVDSLAQLLAVPEFSGQTVNR